MIIALSGTEPTDQLFIASIVQRRLTPKCWGVLRICAAERVLSAARGIQKGRWCLIFMAACGGGLRESCRCLRFCCHVFQKRKTEKRPGAGLSPLDQAQLSGRSRRAPFANFAGPD